MTNSLDTAPKRTPPPSASDRIDCVYLTCFRSDFSFAATVLYYSRIRLHRAETLEEADFLLTVTAATVLLSDMAFLDGSWRDALQMSSEMHSHVATLVVAENVDQPYLPDSEVCASGACGILWKPLVNDRSINLIRAVDEAARNRMAVAMAGRF